MDVLGVGEPAPDFELSDTAGRARRLSDALQNGPVLLVFYHGDCPTCEFAMPFVQRLHAARGESSGAQVWGISQDDMERSRQFARDAGLEFPILIEPEPYDISMAFGIEFVPAFFVVETDGRTRWSDYGFSKEAFGYMAALLDAAPLEWDAKIPARRPGCRSKN